jgi:hypothetical protein
MARIISVSLDLTKIDKSKIYEHQNGSKYFQIDIVVNDEKDKFGQDVWVTASQNKEERDGKVPKVYLGNGKTVWSNEGNTQITQNNTQNNNVNPATGKSTPVNNKGINYSGDDDDLPF